VTGWSGRYSPGDAGWLEALEEAVAADHPHRTPARTAELVLRFDAMLFSGESSPPAPGLPQGRPGRQTRRHLAINLLRLADASRHPDAPVWRALGLLHRTANPRRDPCAAPGRDPEVLQRLQDTRASAEEAEALGDPVLRAITVLHRAGVERDAFHLHKALASAEAMLAILPQDAAPAPLLDALGQPRWLDPETLVSRVRCAAYVRASLAAFMLRDYPRTAEHRQLATDEAARLIGSAPTLYISCLWRQAELARHIGDIRAMRNYQDAAESFAQGRPGDEPVQREFLRASYYAHCATSDWDAAIAARMARTASWMRTVGCSNGPVSPVTALAAVREAKLRSESVALTGIGNDAYELAKCLIESDRAGVDPVAAAEARDWLAVAAAAWEGTGLNGLHAVAFRRLELDAMEGRSEPREVGQAMVAASRGWRRVAGQRNAAYRAAVLGAAGDPLVLERLLELRADAPAVDAAFLDLGIAQWHLNHGDALRRSGGPDDAAEQWLKALEASLKAEGGLVAPQASGRELLLHPERHLDALRLQVFALQRLRAAEQPGFVDTAQELSARARSLPSVAQLMVNALTSQQRAAVGRRTDAWLADTVQLASHAQDISTADMAMEVVRRDRVGAILAAMCTDPQIPQQISDLAGLLGGALAISFSDAGGDADVELADQEPDESGTRAAALGEQIEAALDLTEQLIGPLARKLFDPASAAKPPAEVLQVLHSQGAAAVLSLWLAPGPQGPLLVRRLMHRRDSGAPVEQHLDIIDAPRWLPGLGIDERTDLFFARLQQLGGLLLPPPLQALLATADPDHPVAVTVVPTGLLSIPFAALPVCDRYLLLDLAVITTVQSLRTAVVLAEAGVSSPAGGAFGIYDLDRLAHAAAEWDDLRRHYPPGRPLKTLAELQDAFGGDGPMAGAVLAIALHGEPGQDGWAQAKLLPDGQALTPGHVLRWQVPPIVVGASCFTDIRTSADGELAGFPIAFQLRGAGTVIGTLYEVHDRHTAEIMGLFYAAAAAGLPPAAALRAAQRTWIAKDRPERLPAAEHWALLIAYGVR
jgi:hypothetical protein